MRQRSFFALVLGLAAAGCARDPGLFSEPNARAHVEMLAGTIGSRPIGTEANARARAYLVDQLKLYGFEVRVQETDARNAAIGRTARVSNIIAMLPGTRPEAIGLVAHYDSTPFTPGAGDDAVGAAVVVETARLLAAKKDRRWTIYVLITDGEEAGLMGASALVTDRTITDRLKAYINIEASGSGWPAVLFETGPGNGWLVGLWARHAPHPRGGSFAKAVYRRLPNDTDFSVLKRHDIPGLNFALVGDSAAYHTARDTPERLSPRSLRYTGENVAAIAAALDGVDITARTTAEPTYFDLGGTSAVTFGWLLSWIVSAAAVLLGAIAWIRMLRTAVAVGGTGRWILTLFWTIAGAAVVFAAMAATTLALRAAREVYHPWYAHPGRLLALLAIVGGAAGWGVTRAGAWLPARVHGVRHPAVTWSIALPAWLFLALAGFWLAPEAAYLWTVPLLAAGLLLSIVPKGSGAAVRIASLLILIVVATLWLRDTVELFRYAVAIFGRLPLVTPVYAYAALLAAAALMLVPPFVGALGAARPLVRPTFVTALLLVAVTVAAGMAYAAPAYTSHSPLRRHVRALQEPGAASATWEIASAEPGIDLEAGGPTGWARPAGPLAASVPWGSLEQPFVFRSNGPALGPAPVDTPVVTTQPVTGGVELSVSVVPQRLGLAVAFVLPAGLVPVRSSLPGTVRQGRWTATYLAPPREGIAWRASFREPVPASLDEVRVAVTDYGFPGGAGAQRLPAWLPQERAVWTATATWVVRPLPPLEPVRPLR